MTNVFTFLQEKNLLPLLIPIFFVKSKQKKINGLFEKEVFKIVFILKVLKNIKIFNFCFVDEIKNIEIANAFKKSRLVVQTYNDYNKISIFIQSSII